MAKSKITFTANPKTTFLDLPNELILEIANHVDSQTQLSRMSQINRRLHEVLTGELLRRNVRDDGSSAVLWAFRNNDVGMLSRLRSYGANLDNPKRMPPRWGTLLSQAAREGNFVMVEVLIQLGVDPMQDLGGGYKPIVSALASGQVEMTKLLIPFLPSLEFPVLEDGSTTLHVAASWRCGEIVRHLMMLRADPNFKARDTNQSTFDHLLGTDGVEFHPSCGWYFDDDEEEEHDGAFDMLTILLEEGAEPDDEAYAKGATSSIDRVRHLFCGREISIGKKKAIKSRPKAHRQENNILERVNGTEEWQNLRLGPADKYTSDQRSAFPPLSASSPPSAIASQTSWHPLNEPLDRNFPPLAGSMLERKNTKGTSQRSPSEIPSIEKSQNDRHRSGSKSGKTSNRKWQKLQL